MKLESVLIKCVLVLSLLSPALPERAQRELTLDECRALTLDGKHLKIDINSTEDAETVQNT